MISDLGSKEIRIYQENLQTEWKHISNLFPKVKTLLMSVKTGAEVGIHVFSKFIILLAFYILF